MPLETKPLHTFALCLGRRLTDKELNIGHIVGAICKNLYKPEFKKNLDGTFNGTNLVVRDNGKTLECVWQAFTDQQQTVIGQRDKVEFEQQENI